MAEYSLVVKFNGSVFADNEEEARVKVIGDLNSMLDTHVYVYKIETSRVPSKGRKQTLAKTKEGTSYASNDTK